MVRVPPRGALQKRACPPDIGEREFVKHRPKPIPEYEPTPLPGMHREREL